MPLLQVFNVFSEKLLGGFCVSDITFTQNNKEQIAIVGETGSGKTTLLKMIGGYTQAASGIMLLDGVVLKGPDWQLIPGHKDIAYLSQHFELRHNYKMQDLLAIDNQLNESETHKIFFLCKIDHLLLRNSKQLSGGEKQRVALAKLLLTKPKLLLLDEPFSNLDAIHKQILKQVLSNISLQFEMSCILASHDALDVLPWANNIIVLKQGVIVQEGSATIIFYNPINEYVAALFGAYTVLDKNIATLFNLNYNNTFEIIRPSQWVINTLNGVPGLILSCAFMGNYYQLEVRINNIIVFVFDNIFYNINDKIFLNIVHKNIVY
jgi:ABC-type sulfate/molybdate transport systems ATPase subunit